MKPKNKKRISGDPLNRDFSQIIEKGKWVKLSELFEMQPKNKVITLRISEDLLKEIKNIAEKEDTNYQKIIRNILIDFVSKKDVSKKAA